MSNSPEQELDPFGDLDINPEFIEENKKMITNSKMKQKSKPHSKSENTKRRKEVFRLYFENGLPAAAIAEHMKVPRNTINNDILVLYRGLQNDSAKIDFYDFYGKQMLRMEMQRARLMSYLEKEQDLERKLGVERQLADIDLKLLSMAAKVEYSSVSFWNEVSKKYNEIADEKKDGHRVTTLLELVKISTKGRRILDEILKERIPWENDRTPK
jgi:predicted DNA-binding protein YlxM (UPF0122 family)